MRTHRRGFFRILGGALALVWVPVPARALELAPGIHRGTRNTRRGALGAWRPRLVGRPAAFKAYPGAARQSLPAPMSEPARPLAEVVRGFSTASGFEAGGSLSLPQLARLLYFTNGGTGRTRGLVRRAAPSAGAFYAGEVYVVAERVAGLAPGIYSYHVGAHELVELERGSFAAELEDALEQPARIAGAPALILLTNVFQRYAWRYANRGYRFALIDTGHIGENLRLAARSAALGENGPLRFHDDRLAAMLGVDGRKEAVCALHALGPASGLAAAPPHDVRRFVEKQAAGGAPAGGSIPERYHEASKLLPAPEGERAPTSPAWALAADEPAAWSKLPRPSPGPSASVEQVIRQRRSAPRFGAEPVRLEDLGFVLEMARGHPALERAPDLDLYLAAHRVVGLAPGLYLYRPEGHRLGQVRSGSLADAMLASCLGQEMAGSAAVGFLTVARFRTGSPPLGDRGYRNLCLESGAVCQRVYLAAEASGLKARNLAAFMDDDLNRVLGWDGQRQAVIHLTMLGQA